MEKNTLKKIHIGKRSSDFYIHTIFKAFLSSAKLDICGRGKYISKAVDICENIVRCAPEKFSYDQIKLNSIDFRGKRASEITISIDLYPGKGSPIKQEFQVNKHINLKYRPFKTHVYIDGENVFCCPKLMDLETSERIDVDPKTEFRINCQRIQDWVFSGYDYHLIDPRISFPILRKLFKLGYNEVLPIIRETVRGVFHSDLNGEAILNEYYLGYNSLDKEQIIADVFDNIDLKKVNIENLCLLCWKNDLNAIEELFSRMKEGRSGDILYAINNVKKFSVGYEYECFSILEEIDFDYSLFPFPLLVKILKWGNHDVFEIICEKLRNNITLLKLLKPIHSDLSEEEQEILDNEFFINHKKIRKCLKDPK